MTAPLADFDVITGPSVPRAVRNNATDRPAVSAGDLNRAQNAAAAGDPTPAPHMAPAASLAGTRAMLRAPR